jgi:hypothetical protein
MLKRIILELSVKSCEKALKELEKYQKEIVPKLNEVCKRLAEIGRDEAISVVNGIRLAEGNHVERIDAVPIENGYKIVMEGEDVYFIEFGTGDGVSAHYDTSVPVAWGTWSEEHSQMLFNQGFWYYDRVRYTGTPAYMPMYYAEKKMREEMPRVVKEVFGK